MIQPVPVARIEVSGVEHGLRERKKIRTRVAIEDAALALFEQHGYEATTVEDIAALAEVSTTTFLRCFPSNAEMLVSEHGQQLPALHLRRARPRSGSWSRRRLEDAELTCAGS